MWHHFDLSPYIPAHLTTAASLVNVLRIARLLEFAPVVGQDIGGNHLGVIAQKTKRAAQANTIINQPVRNGDRRVQSRSVV
jgi:hypothetical protein